MDNDLQTDACPSPPRDQIQPETVHVSKSNKQHQQQVPDDHPTETPINGTDFTKKHTGKTRCENVIYINKSKDIHIGSTTTYTINVGSGKGDTQSGDGNHSNFQLTNQIRQLFTSKERLQRDHLIVLSEHISTANWRLLARKLGYSEGQIEHFFADHHMYGIKEVIYQCLLDWIQDKPSEALIGELTSLLWSCNEREAVDKFSQHIPNK